MIFAQLIESSKYLGFSVGILNLPYLQISYLRTISSLLGI